MMNHLDSQNYIPISPPFSVGKNANKAHYIIDAMFERCLNVFLLPVIVRKLFSLSIFINKPLTEVDDTQSSIEHVSGITESFTSSEILLIHRLSVHVGIRKWQSWLAKLFLTIQLLQLSRYGRSITEANFQDNNHLAGFKTWIQLVEELVIDNTASKYNVIHQILSPFPPQSHYTINLLDVSKVIQGIIALPMTHIKKQLILLYLVHESTPVFFRPI